MWYVYIVQCEDSSFYTGTTDDPERRFKEHSTKRGGRYTKLHRGVELLYTEAFPTKREALDRERQIKGWRREKKINLIKFGKPILN
jgi:putative endonuclease